MCIVNPLSYRSVQVFSVEHIAVDREGFHDYSWHVVAEQKCVLVSDLRGQSVKCTECIKCELFGCVCVWVCLLCVWLPRAVLAFTYL